MVNTDDDGQDTEPAETTTFREECERRVILSFRLHKHLMNVIQYLGAYEDVGIDEDDNCSSEMALYQLRTLEDEAQQAAECVVELPQTEFIVALHTAIQMIRQNVQIAESKSDGVGDEDIIRYARAAVQESHEEVAGSLKRMAALLLTFELTAEIRARTQVLEEQYASVQARKVSIRQPVSKRAGRILEKLRSLPEHKGMDTSALLAYLQSLGDNIDDGTLRKALRELEPYGIDNRPKIGYFVR
jgi:hypothetical protein